MCRGMITLLGKVSHVIFLDGRLLCQMCFRWKTGLDTQEMFALNAGELNGFDRSARSMKGAGRLGMTGLNK